MKLQKQSPKLSHCRSLHIAITIFAATFQACAPSPSGPDNPAPHNSGWHATASRQFGARSAETILSLPNNTVFIYETGELFDATKETWSNVSVSDEVDLSDADWGAGLSVRGLMMVVNPSLLWIFGQEIVPDPPMNDFGGRVFLGTYWNNAVFFERSDNKIHVHKLRSGLPAFTWFVLNLGNGKVFLRTDSIVDLPSAAGVTQLDYFEYDALSDQVHKIARTYAKDGGYDLVSDNLQAGVLIRATSPYGNFVVPQTAYYSTQTGFVVIDSTGSGRPYDRDLYTAHQLGAGKLLLNPSKYVSSMSYVFFDASLLKFTELVDSYHQMEDPGSILQIASNRWLVLSASGPQCAIFDATSMNWSLAQSTHFVGNEPRYAYRLNNGDIFEFSVTSASTEVFEGNTSAWRSIPTIYQYPVGKARFVPLHDGRILSLNGLAVQNGSELMNGCEIFTP